MTPLNAPLPPAPVNSRPPTATPADPTPAGAQIDKARLTPIPQYENPKPVTVGLMPVLGPEGIGLLVVRRAIEPGKGKLALPGGYMVVQDPSWQAALAREVSEETGLKLTASAVRPSPLAAESVANGRNLLLFGRLKPIRIEQLQGLTPDAETSEVTVIYKPTELAFSTHTQQADRFFAQLARKKAKSQPA